ncbi:hypothetical protein [Paenibacillus validus]|uniref:hypothetical protein n=1 Tax=Paenibacillus validus TaxID=44253 RepID=UPI003D28DE47
MRGVNGLLELALAVVVALFAVIATWRLRATSGALLLLGLMIALLAGQYFLSPPRCNIWMS